MELFVQLLSLAFSSVAVAVYYAFMRSLSPTPKGCYFLLTGFSLNALQKITIIETLNSTWSWVHLFDLTIFPFLEGLLYAIAVILLYKERQKVLVLFHEKIKNYVEV